MSTEVVIPQDLWDEDGEGVITSWLAADGSEVAQGTLIVEVMTEKIQHEIEAPASGILSIKTAEDEVVNKGDVIARIE